MDDKEKSPIAIALEMVHKDTPEANSNSDEVDASVASVQSEIEKIKEAVSQSAGNDKAIADILKNTKELLDYIQSLVE